MHEHSARPIRQQLARILGHREFQATAKMRDFLRFVVEETLAGRDDQLKGFTIATEVFGRGPDFDPAHDPIVRIQAGRLRRALERYYLVAGGQDPVHIDIPKGGYVPSFTPRVPTTMIRPDAPATRRDPSYGPTLAVLPLECLGGDSEQSYFGIGLVEDLVTELGRFQDIVVIPCQRLPYGASGNCDPAEVARRSGARFILGGSVRRDATVAKVSVHLVDSATGREIWAHGYRHELAASRLIETQEEIARAVVTTIASEHGIIARRLSAESRKKAPGELDTYEAMLRYYGYQIEPSPEKTGPCFNALESAVKREPGYGPAWSALATLYCQLHCFDAPEPQHPLDTALEYARRGVSLEPGAQITRLILAYVSYVAEDLDTFHHEVETTLSLNSNSPYNVGAAGYFFVMLGDFERGLPLLDEATQVNPLHPRWFYSAYIADALRTGRFDAGLQLLETYQPVQGFWAPAVRAALMGQLDRMEEAAAALEELLAIRPDFGTRGLEIMRRTLKAEDVLQSLVDGLQKSGLCSRAG